MLFFCNRDAGIIALGHFVWAILCCVLVFSLLGVAHASQRINLDNLLDPLGADLFVKITGRGLWLVGVTLGESAAATLDFSWLWSGLLFLLVALACVATLAAAFEVLSACVVDEFPSVRQYKPAIAFTMLCAVFLLNLLMATEVSYY